MIGATERVAHVAECLPEICTLDCGTMNFAEADYVMTNTPGMLTAMGRMMTDLGVENPRLRPLIPAIFGMQNNWLPMACWTARPWCSYAWECRGARQMISIPLWRW